LCQCTHSTNRLSAQTPVLAGYHYCKPVTTCNYEVTGLSDDGVEVLEKARQSKRRLLPNVGGPISCSMSLYVSVSFSSRASATYEHASRIHKQTMQCDVKAAEYELSYFMQQQQRLIVIKPRMKNNMFNFILPNKQQTGNARNKKQTIYTY